VKLHWKLDTAFREDACRVGQGDAAENFAKVRHIALNLLNADNGFSVVSKESRKKPIVVKVT